MLAYVIFFTYICIMKRVRYIITTKNPYIKGGTVTWVYLPVWDGSIENYLNNDKYIVEKEEVEE